MEIAGEYFWPFCCQLTYLRQNLSTELHSKAIGELQQGMCLGCASCRWRGFANSCLPLEAVVNSFVGPHIAERRRLHDGICSTLYHFCRKDVGSNPAPGNEFSVKETLLLPLPLFTILYSTNVNLTCNV